MIYDVRFQNSCIVNRTSPFLYFFLFLLTPQIAKHETSPQLEFSRLK